MTGATVNAPAQAQPPAITAVDLLLRHRGAILERIRSGDDLAGLAKVLLLTIALCGAVFGGTLGAFRGGAQIAYAALKLPLVMLLTAAICAPALTALNSGLCRPACIRRDLALVLAALARGSLCLGALTPVLLLAVILDLSYHRLVLLTVACCAVGGIVGLRLLLGGLGAEPRSRVAVSLALVTVLLPVGAQMTWTLRPYLLRPRTPNAPVVRSLESSFLEAVAVSFRSAGGHYRRGAAPLPEADGPRRGSSPTTRGTP